MHINSRLNHVALAVKDPARSARIFEKLFGAEVAMSGPEHRGPPEVSAHLPGLTLVLVAGSPASSAPSAGHIALNVTAAELAAAKAHLAQLGIAFEEPRHGRKDRGLYFVDHDNNLFELCVVESTHEGAN